MPKFFRNIVGIILAALITSCGFFSFTGASISADMKTFAVAYFPNRSATVQPSLSQVFTENLKDYFKNFGLTPKKIGLNSAYLMQILKLQSTIHYFCKTWFPP